MYYRRNRMKAILIIDIPNSCYDCPCYYEDLGKCEAINKTVKADYDVRPSWCPLRQMPDKAAKTLLNGLDAFEKMKSVEVKTIRKTE